MMHLQAVVVLASPLRACPDSNLSYMRVCNFQSTIELATKQQWTKSIRQVSSGRHDCRPTLLTEKPHSAILRYICNVHIGIIS